MVAEMWRRSVASTLRKELWKGKPFLKWHDHKGVVQCLDIEERVTSSFKRERGRRKEWTLGEDDGEKENEDEEQAEPAAPVGQALKLAASGRSRPQAKRPAAQADQDAPPAGEWAEVMKALTPGVRVVNEGISVSNGLLKAIEDADEEWARFNHPTALNPLKTARAALDNAISTAFWKKALTTPQKHIRKTVTEENDPQTVLFEIGLAVKVATQVTEECSMLYDQREAVRKRKSAA